ncbi:MAG: bifunctional diaminohydroxyphosphoribosylaminopyrimidine deaminase/5-amino-6-(5-phosphoribosylamino)uracil reductase RibD, partial [Actinomycetota bacterium]|nr:bifunctional diaminohydroxyphosphoribosylaminopyrimidine deaminase/5-amino-6-(5-phosphoribosylamino)uracil reductase RibD [Actinomycetota bacterium]
ARRGNDPRGSTAYFTLEPCAHHGTQPPCADALMEAGVGGILIGEDDPTGKTAGVGPRRMSEAGIEVSRATGRTASRCRELVQDFRKRSLTGKPLVTLKLAMTLDGRVATRTGDSRWITGPESRRLVHHFRAEMDAVAVGSGTVAADDPKLTVRFPGTEEAGGTDDRPGEFRQPTRVIFDSGPLLTPEAALFDDVGAAPVVIAAGPAGDGERLAALERAGATVIRTADATRAERVAEALTALGSLGIASLLLEGGPTLAGVALTAGEVDRLEIFTAPMILGGGRMAVAGDGPDLIADAIRVPDLRVSRVGQDVRMSARIKEW